MKNIMPLMLLYFFALNVEAKTPQDLTTLIGDSTDLSDVTHLPKEYEDYVRSSDISQKELVGGLTCSDIESRAKSNLEKVHSPRQLLKQIVKQAPKVLLIGEVHFPEDFKKWEDDTIEFYRKMRPDVDCIFREAPLFALDAELKLFGGKLYRQNHNNIEKTVNAFANSKSLGFKSFRDDEGPRENFNMGIGPDLPFDGWKGNLVIFDHARVSSEELINAFDNNLKIIDVDIRHPQHNRNIFMSNMMSGLITNGFCTAAIGIFGKGHLQYQKYLLARAGVSSYTLALSNFNSYKVKVPFNGTATGTGFMNYSTKCPNIKIALPKPPFSLTSEKNIDIPPNDSHDDFFFTLNGFDGNIVQSVNLKRVVNIYTQ